VDTLAEPSGEFAPISLYVALEAGSRGDLEVISRAAIAWAEAIREAAFLTDPFLEVRVELVSGTESSINLNSLIHAVRGTISDRKKLRSIAIGIAAFFAHDALDWARGKGYDALWDWVRTEYGIVVEELTVDEKRDAEQIVQRIATSKSTGAKSRTVYEELRKDPVVTGVGIAFQPGVRPNHIVPRSEFAERAGSAEIEQETISRRTETDRLTLTLAAPEISGSDNKWKFTLAGKTLWARMGDDEFKNRLRPGSDSAPHMVTGIRMDVTIETDQELRNSVWTTINQTIVKVHSLAEPLLQPGWLDSPTENEKPQ